MSLKDELGPLPEVHANSSLEQQSVKSLNALLKTDRQFLLRDERIGDFGVDASLELLVEGHATNCRSQIQMKAVQNLSLNGDGSRSKQIEVSNLNYLLNGSTPMYVLYVATEDAFYFTWAADEQMRLQKENHAWLTQGTVTLRFRERLEQSKFQGIADRILREARLKREVMEHVGIAAGREAVHLAISPETLKTNDAAQARELVVESGLTAVTNGFAKEILRLIDLLRFDEQIQPRVQLVSAYAWYSLGRSQKALGAVGEALTRMNELDAVDLGVLLQIRDATELQTGRISHEEFVNRLREERDASTGAIRDPDNINRLRFQYLGERDRNKRLAALSALRDAVESLQKDGSSRTYQLQGQIFLAYCEGAELSTNVGYTVATAKASTLMNSWGGRADSRVIADAFADFANWELGVESLIKACERHGVPVLTAEALRTRLVTRTFYLWSLRFCSRFVGVGIEPAKSDFIAPRADGERALSIFKLAAQLEGELLTKLNLASLSELAGDEAEAKRISSEVLPVAQALGLTNVMVEAERYLNSKTLLQETEEKMRTDRDPDAMADIPDDRIDEYATGILDASGLPKDRLPQIRYEVLAYRHVARLRRGWCKHLELIEDLRHSRSRITAYALPVTYFGQCNKHRYESVMGDTDAVGILKRFKAAFCEECVDRCPRG